MQTQDFSYTGEELDVMSVAQNYHRWVTGIFEPYLKGRAIEVGAGIGTVSKFIAPLCERLTTIEPDAENFKHLSVLAESEAKINAFHGTFSEYALTTEKRQDINTILYINVLEHIEDDEAELREAIDLLTTDGHLCIFVPAIKCLYGDIDKQIGHFRRYSKSELKQLVGKKLNMEIVHSGYFDFAGIIPWYIFSCLLKKNSPTSASVKLYDKVVVPIMSRVERWLPMPCGKNLYIVARKK